MQTTNELFKNKKLKLKYPCKWKYTLISKGKLTISELDELLVNVLNKKYKIVKVNNSKNKKFMSNTIELMVDGDKDRKMLWDKLKQLPDIAMVL